MLFVILYGVGSGCCGNLPRPGRSPAPPRPPPPPPPPPLRPHLLQGICSNFLCDAKPGQEITMTGEAAAPLFV